MKILHSVFAGLGGHTSVFWAHQNFAQTYNAKLIMSLYGIEKPLKDTIKSLEERNIEYLYTQKRGRFDFFHPIRYALRIRKIQPDIIFMHGNYGIIFIYAICVLLGKSKLIIRETQATTLKTIRQKLNTIFSLLFTHKVVFLSESYKKSVLDEFPFLKAVCKSNSCVIPNGLDTNFFKSRENNRTDGIVRIGMISRIVPIKDHITLIKAFKLVLDSGIQNVELFIAGDGNYFDVIKNKVNELGMEERIKLTGLIEYHYIAEFLSSLDIYVHSTKGETMSNSIMQAQSMGLPVVASDVFGVNNVIDDKKNGFLFELGNYEELKDILIRLIQDEGLRRHYQAISRKYAEENFSDESMARRYYSLFKEVLKGRLP